MRLFLIFSAITCGFLLGCKILPKRPQLTLGTVVEVVGISSISLLPISLVGIDILLDGGSLLFFLQDRDGAGLKLVCQRYGHLATGFRLSNSTIQLTKEQKAILVQSIKLGRNHVSSSARDKLIEILTETDASVPSYVEWRKMWIADAEATTTRILYDTSRKP